MDNHFISEDLNDVDDLLFIIELNDRLELTAPTDTQRCCMGKCQDCGDDFPDGPIVL